MEAQLLLQEHILALLQEDRERGTELLLETYTPLLWSVCQRRLSDPEDVKECVNDVFSTFCLNPQKFDPEQSSLKNYLAMLADRKAISCYRSNQRRIEAEAAVAHTAQPEQEQTHHSLEEALSMLQPEDAQIIRMKYYGGLTYREIAQQLGLTEDAVKKRSRRSLSKLAKWMLIGLLIAALLVGCTYVVHQYFRYSRGVGVLADEALPVYQAVELPEPICANGIRFHLLNASYSEETLVLTVAYFPDDGGESLSKELYRQLTGAYTYFVNGHKTKGAVYTLDMMCQAYVTIPREELAANKNGQTKIRVDLALDESAARMLQQDHGYEVDLSVLSWDVTLEETAAVQDLTELGYYLETAYVDFLVLTDWEVSSETGDTYTLISLCPIYKTEGLALSDLISTCYNPLNGHKQEYVTLSDAAGNTYSAFRTVRPAPETAATEFTLWFQNLPSGEYTLNFPGLCFQSDEPAHTITLPLPNQDGETLLCSESLTLQDGSVLSLSGVNCQTGEEAGAFMTEYWVDGVQNWVLEDDVLTRWDYSVAYQVTTDDDFPLWGVAFSDDFCYETDDGITPIVTTSGMFHQPGAFGQLAFGARSALNMDAPDYIRLTMREFYYADPTGYSLSLTIE